jgi:hypothetical protein
MADWKRPQGMRLARRLEVVVAELRRCAPVLLEAHVRALEGMAATAHLASRPRSLDASRPVERRELHV